MPQVSLANLDQKNSVALSSSDCMVTCEPCCCDADDGAILAQQFSNSVEADSDQPPGTACNNSSHMCTHIVKQKPVTSSVETSSNSVQYHLRFLGSDLVSPEPNFDKAILDSGLRIDPERFTPQCKCNIDRIVDFDACRKHMLHNSGRVLFVSLPGFGTSAGNRRCITKTRNIAELIRAHLVNQDNHVIIDGARGNPARKQDSIEQLVKHQRFQNEQVYHWCAAGVKVNDKPHKRQSKVCSTMLLPSLDDWNKCC